MLENKYLILVGGTGRNVGKTEFVCQLISTIAKDYDVYGLKVSSIFPDEAIYHGTHEGKMEDLRLFEEKRLDTTKDTSRMLRAGAKKVYYLQSDDNHILKHYLDFLDCIPKDSIIVCESNSLYYHVRPVMHLLVTDGGPVKPRAKKQLSLADRVITSQGKNGFAEIEAIYSLLKTGWQE